MSTELELSKAKCALNHARVEIQTLERKVRIIQEEHRAEIRDYKKDTVRLERLESANTRLEQENAELRKKLYGSTPLSE